MPGFRSAAFRSASILVGRSVYLVHGIYGALQRWTICSDGFAAMALETRLLNNGAWAKRWVLNAPPQYRGRPPIELSEPGLFSGLLDRRDEPNSPAGRKSRNRFTNKTALIRVIKASLAARFPSR